MLLVRRWVGLEVILVQGGGNVDDEALDELRMHSQVDKSVYVREFVGYT